MKTISSESEHFSPPNSHAPLSVAAPTQNLRRLFGIRNLVLMCLTATTAISYAIDPLLAPFTYIVLALLLLAVINGLTWWRLRQTWPVTSAEFFIHMLVDVLSLSTLLYVSGGASNPLVSYLLIPICIASATLPWRYTWALVAVGIGAYTLLLFHHLPVPILSPAHNHHDDHGGLSPHIMGMWLNFFLSALLIAYFVVLMARSLRQQEQALVSQKEEMLQNEKLLGVATLAAGTAHELGTPLSTMKVLLQDLSHDTSLSENVKQDINLLSTQVSQCSDTLKKLVSTAEVRSDQNWPVQTVYEFCHEILQQWQLINPKLSTRIHLQEVNREYKVTLPTTLRQSLLNALNNAADANPNDVKVTVTWNNKRMHWLIDDNGPGVDLHIMEKLGKTFITTKESGLGIGLFLTHSTLTHHGGEIKLYNRDEGGTRTDITLPLAAA